MCFEEFIHHSHCNVATLVGIPTIRRRDDIAGQSPTETHFVYFAIDPQTQPLSCSRHPVDSASRPAGLNCAVHGCCSVEVRRQPCEASPQDQGLAACPRYQYHHTYLRRSYTPSAQLLPKPERPEYPVLQRPPSHRHTFELVVQIGKSLAQLALDLEAQNQRLSANSSKPAVKKGRPPCMYTMEQFNSYNAMYSAANHSADALRALLNSVSREERDYILSAVIMNEPDYDGNPVQLASVPDDLWRIDRSKNDG